MSDDRRWTTEDEIEFIKGLGTWSIASALPTKKQLLLNYRKALHLPSNEFSFDVAIVEKVVVRELKKLATTEEELLMV